MAHFLYGLSLIVILLATAAFTVYLVRQQKSTYRWAYRLLLSGFAFLTVFVGYEYYTLGVTPVLTLKSSLSFFAWTILLVYLLFHLKFRLMVLGSFVAPLAACLLILSSTLPAGDVTVKPIFRSLWLPVHIGTAFVGNGFFAVTFVAGVMYLIQESQIKKKRLGSLYSRLPSLETLDSINHFALICGFTFMTAGMITGSIYAQYALGSYWRWDPKEVCSLLAWIFYAALLHERITVGWRGRRAALLSLFGFLVLVLAFAGANLWLSDYHSFRNLGGRPGE
ncbi:MAG: cytochrome c biogenesis protein CcsA [Deltaproteobacteria bacterium]